MPTSKEQMDSIDWKLTTWEGSRREELRRWARLPLECVISSLEEMQQVTESLFESHGAEN